MTLFRISAIFRSHGFRYSTAVDGISGDRKPLLIVDYLIDSLRFTKQDAISLSSKGNLSHLKSPINSDSVVNSFKNFGLNLPQIREIVSWVPKILKSKAEKTLEPKLRVFKELGLSGSDIVNLIKRNPDVFQFGLHTRIIPCINLLKALLGNDDNVVEFINKSKQLYCTSHSMKRLSKNVSLLQNIGLSNDRIVMFMLNKPGILMADPNLFENKLHYVEQKLGVSHDLTSFIHFVCVVMYVSDSQVEERMLLFRSFGWSDSDITLLFRNQPYCLNKSEANIREKLEFFMKDLGYTPAYLIRCHTFFTYSLNKRVIPRNNVLRILKEKKLVKDKPALISIATYSELKFLEFLCRFEDDIPGLCDIYMDSVFRVS